MRSLDAPLAVAIGAFDFAAPHVTLADTGTHLFVLSPHNGDWKIVADIFKSASRTMKTLVIDAMVIPRALAVM